MKKYWACLVLVIIMPSVGFSQPIVTINSPDICLGSSATLTATVTGGTAPYSYQWSSGNTTNPVVMNPSVTTTYTCTVTDFNSNTGSATGTVTVHTSVPAQPTPINGPTSVCTNQCSLSYSVSNVPGTTYNWGLPSGWTISGGFYSNTITVCTSTIGGIVSVTPSNACGSGPQQTLNVTAGSVPGQPGPISGPVNVCANQCSIVYSVPYVAGIIYFWTVPSGWTIISGMSSNSIVVCTGTSSGIVSVTPGNGYCNGPSETLAVAVGNVPAQPGTITGPANPCANTCGIVYSITSVPRVSYNWTIPPDWIFNLGYGTDSIDVCTGNMSGTIIVTPSNTCGNGTPRTLAVTLNNLPQQPSAIAGDPNPCINQTNLLYSVTNVPGMTYTWSVPPVMNITSGNGTSSISANTTNTPGSGMITVVPGNVCGNGPARTLAVNIVSAVPALPSPVSGDPAPCTGSAQTYSVTNVNGVDYTWTVPSDWTITAGQNTNSLNVIVGSLSGSVTVTPDNGCGSGPVQSMTVNVTPLPNITGPINMPVPYCSGVTIAICIMYAPGVSYYWTVPPGWTILSGQYTNCIQVMPGLNGGNITVVPGNGCGSLTPITLAVMPPVQTSLTLSNSNPTICNGQASLLTAGGCVTYTWDPGGITGNSISVSPSVNTTYTVTGADNNGCTASQTTLVTVIPCPNIVTRAGMIFRDFNNSGTRDPGEPPMINRIVQEDPLGYYFATNDSGVYSAYYNSGTYTLWPHSYQNHCSFNPVTQTLTSLTDSTNDFAYFCWPFNDVFINMSTCFARPGYTTQIFIVYGNNGTAAASGQIELVYDQYLTYTGSSTPYSYLSNDTIRWNYTNLPAGGTGNINVTFGVSPVPSIGDTIFYHAMITPLAGDSVSADNLCSAFTELTNSFDPNEKLVSKSLLSQQEVLTEPALIYTIHFQNTGSAPAINVAVRDSLSGKLIIPSLEIMGASHPYSFSITPGGTAVWTFNNISLPDSGTSFTGSQGYVMYKIKAKSSLQNGDVIYNNAGIIFDFNPPVITNTASTLVDFTTGMQQGRNGHTIGITPNPVTGLVNITYCDPASTSLKMRIVSISGQVIEACDDEHFSGMFSRLLDMHDLPTGIYFVKLMTENNTVTGKIVLIR